MNHGNMTPGRVTIDKGSQMAFSLIRPKQDCEKSFCKSSKPECVVLGLLSVPRL